MADCVSPNRIRSLLFWIRPFVVRCHFIRFGSASDRGARRSAMRFVLNVATRRSALQVQAMRRL
jgi:hypothetical protein